MNFARKASEKSAKQWPGVERGNHQMITGKSGAVIQLRASALAIAALTVGGCGTTSPVTLASNSKSEFEGAVYSGEVTELESRTPGAELYRVFQQGGSGFVSVASVRNAVDGIATQFCTRKGKNVRAIQERASK